jgi:hypothetical protein
MQYLKYRYLVTQMSICWLWTLFLVIQRNHDRILSVYNTNDNILLTEYSDYFYTDLNFLLFDWEGNLLTKFILSDNKFVESFAVDFKRNKVYCYLPLEKDHNIYMYNLNP